MGRMQGVLDISVRVSRQGKRAEDSFYSDDNQEEACRALIERKGYAVGEVVREVNVSGGKAAKDRGVERLIARVESGESAGIVVYDFSRLTREDTFAATMLVGRIHLAGGVVFGVADSYDSSAPMAAVMTALYAEQAHSYLKVARERTHAGRMKAREHGRYITRTPIGYGRDGKPGRLVPGEWAELVPVIFARRLAGDSYADLVRLAATQGLKITTGGIRKMLSNPVYIGKAESGPSPALVDEETFARVQRMTTTRKATGRGAQTLSQGLARCSNCGGTLIVTKVRDKLQFYCRGTKLGGCDRRGCIMGDALDSYVERAFLAAFEGNGPLARAYADATAVVETGKLLDAARFELAELQRSTSLVSTLGLSAFEAMIEGAAAKVELAEQAHADAKANADTLGGVVSLLEAWKAGRLDLAAKRRLLATAIERVEVGNGRVPVERKARVIFKGNVTLDTPDDARARLALVEDRAELAAHVG